MPEVPVQSNPTSPATRSGLVAVERLFVSDWFFAGVLGVLFLIVATDVVNVLGARPAEVIRRNSEGVAMVLTAWYWLLFAGNRDLAGQGRLPTKPREALHAAWLGGWVAAAIVLQAVALGAMDLSLSPRIITLGEAAATVAVLSLYMGVTRGLGSGPLRREDNGVVPSIWWRGGLLATFTISVVAVHLAGPDVVPPWLDDLVRLNVEAVAGIILLVVTIEAIVTPPIHTAWVFGWCVLMLVLPVGTRTALGSVLPPGLVDWISRGTEAFLAAFVVTLWFWAWHHRRDGRYERE